MQQNQACSLEYRPVFANIERAGRRTILDTIAALIVAPLAACGARSDGVKSNELTELGDSRFHVPFNFSETFERAGLLTDIIELTVTISESNCNSEFLIQSSFIVSLPGCFRIFLRVQLKFWWNFGKKNC